MAGRNLDIQALRGVAILMVFAQHYRGRLPTAASYDLLFRHGTLWGGVDLFFAISGYVICRSLFDRTRNLRGAGLDLAGFRAFWIRRAFRLLPAAWLWAAIAALAAPVLASVPGLDPIPVAKAAAAGMLGYANLYWHGCLAGGTLAPGCPHPDLHGVYWSLSLEEQFYALFSIALLLSGLRGAVLGCLALALAWPVAGAPFGMAWSLRPQALCLGVAAYALTRTTAWGSLATRPGRIPRLAGMGACLAAIYAAPVQAPGCALAIMAVAAALAVLLAQPDGAFGTGPAARSLRWIGERSYALYLCHLPVILLLREGLSRAGWLGSAAWLNASCLVGALLAALALADLTHRWVERPATGAGAALARRFHRPGGEPRIGGGGPAHSPAA